MIIVRDTLFASRREAPPWMEGAAELHEREDVNGRLWGIGNGMFLGPAPDSAWKNLANGYQCRLVKGFAPIGILRRPLWCPLHSAYDQPGRQWMLPQILDANGSTPVIQAIYDERWLPDYSEAQQLSLAAAKWSRSAHETETPIETELACKAAADLLSAVYHLTPEVIGALRLLDHGLMISTLRFAAGYGD